MWKKEKAESLGQSGRVWRGTYLAHDAVQQAARSDVSNACALWPGNKLGCVSAPGEGFYFLIGQYRGAI